MSEASPSSPTGRKPNFDDYPRVLGVILLALGLIFGFVAFYFPIHDALQGAAKISVHSKAVSAFVILTILGLTLIILGPVAVRLAYKGVALKSWKKWLVVGLIMVLFIAAVELVQQVFEQYLGTFGYKF
ncbi:MAG: hypothetical protein HY790_02830 [Deltaproteobacteria bacterium]|nr:hypothetical protein [Deltaproteobacteria bacterium]MBI4794765.1 hypothetical protein [Deltaproteobacteria bacterium]